MEDYASIVARRDGCYLCGVDEEYVGVCFRCWYKIQPDNLRSFGQPRGGGDRFPD